MDIENTAAYEDAVVDLQQQLATESKIDSVTPGPGTYNVEHRATGFKKNIKDEKY